MPFASGPKPKSHKNSDVLESLMHICGPFKLYRL